LKHILIIILLLITTPAATQESVWVPARARWSPPATSIAYIDYITLAMPAVRYVIQHSVNGQAWYVYATTDDTTLAMSVNYYDAHRVRVAGIDSLGRIGEFSPASNTYAPIDSMPGPVGEVVRLVGE